MDKLTALLILTATPQLGCAKINRIVAQLPPEQFVALSTAELRHIGLTSQQINAIHSPDQQRLSSALEWQLAPNHHILTQFDPQYPSLLAEIPDPPPILYVSGDINSLQSPQIALVGSRHASKTGLQNAYQLAQQLVTADISITSGLALGVDAMAHQAALDSNGVTIAVMATGLDQVYPKRHRYLAEQIQQSGALMSENPLGSQPFPAAFPKRNRLISGLSLGTVIVEAAKKSGSLITARLALEQGREVFAIPGALNNPLADGCNALIQQGAKLIVNAADIMEEITTLNCRLKKQQISHSAAKEAQLTLPFGQLLDSVGYEFTSVDEVAIQNNQPVATVTAALIELELEGYITSVPGGYVRVRRGC